MISFSLLTEDGSWWQSATNWAGDKLNQFTNFAGDTFNKASNGATSMYNKASETASDTFNKASNGASSMYNKASETASDLMKPSPKPEPELPLGPRTPATVRDSFWSGNSGIRYGGDRPDTLEKAIGDWWYSNRRPTVHNANNVDEHIKNLEQDNARIRSAYSHETNGQSGDPGSSWWSWIPGSDESRAENRIEDNEAEIRRMKNEPELFDHLRDGTPAPGFLDHPIGWTYNAIADNPWTTALGAGALAAGAWYLNKKSPFNFNRQQPSFTDRLKNIFSNKTNNSGSFY